MAVADSKVPRLHHDDRSRGGGKWVRSTLENMIYITLRPGTSGGVTKFLAMKQGERDAQLSLARVWNLSKGRRERANQSRKIAPQFPNMHSIHSLYITRRVARISSHTEGGRVKNSRDEYLVDESSSQPNILWSPERCFQKFDAKIQNQLKATMRRCKNIHWVTHLSARLARVH